MAKQQKQKQTQQKEKQSQTQSVVVNVKLDKAKPVRRRKARVPAKPKAELRQLPPVAYIMPSGPMPYWGESQPRKTEELPLSMSAVKPLELGKTAGTGKASVPTKKQLLSTFTEPVKPTMTIVEDVKRPAEDISTLVSREKVIPEKPAETVIGYSEKDVPSTLQAPYMASTTTTKPKAKDIPVSRLSKVQLLEKLATEQDIDRNFLRGMSKKEMVMMYKQGKSVAKESGEISDISKTVGVLGKPKKSQGIMEEKPAMRPFWSMAVGEENIPEL